MPPTQRIPPIPPFTEPAGGAAVGRGRRAAPARGPAARVDRDRPRRAAGNFRAPARLVAPARVLAVIKADAYGHGAPEWGARSRPRGVDVLGGGAARGGSRGAPRGRALPDPGARRAASGPAPVLPPLPADPGGLRARPARAVARLAGAVRRSAYVQPIHLQVDTGMSRLGIAEAELPEALAIVRASRHLRADRPPLPPGRRRPARERAQPGPGAALRRVRSTRSRRRSDARAGGPPRQQRRRPAPAGEPPRPGAPRPGPLRLDPAGRFGPACEPVMSVKTPHRAGARRGARDAGELRRPLDRRAAEPRSGCCRSATPTATPGA